MVFILYFCEVRVPAIYMDDVKWCYTAYIIIFFVSYLSDDDFMSSGKVLH
jgi:hypothetical protein